MHTAAICVQLFVFFSFFCVFTVLLCSLFLNFYFVFLCVSFKIFACYCAFLNFNWFDVFHEVRVASAGEFECVLSLLLLSLCVDVLLVCAEGHTQVTGVMAMMMTGRVLLVCALCVLWCGAGGGGSSDPAQVSQDITFGKDNNPKNDNNSRGGAGGGPKSDQLAGSLPAGVSVQDATGAEMKKAIKPEAKVSPTADAVRRNQDRTQGAEDVGKKKNGDMGTKEEEEEEEKKEEAATGTTNEMSAGGQEQPIVSSGAEGASNITNPKSTQTTEDDDPAADGAGTREEKQNENKDANPKETPVTAAATKTTTATTGDSDGSTAVSHTTSPLLLLLVVACAAAAAVVAA
ncbi:mucin-associated surface protein (MASP) [Trypanosoma cruzi Dm28c]|uniref:Mucin-associated surface protein (MASP) n=2 Tax=Trypanosoma cruzi TaxID=5693 RepID=V5B4R4_TRYCR|nr:mucin-associated surface protein (MASP) [Trypanosoma cruzi Dm28c]